MRYRGDDAAFVAAARRPIAATAQNDTALDSLARRNGFSLTSLLGADILDSARDPPPRDLNAERTGGLRSRWREPYGSAPGSDSGRCARAAGRCFRGSGVR